MPTLLISPSAPEVRSLIIEVGLFAEEGPPHCRRKTDVECDCVAFVVGSREARAAATLLQRAGCIIAFKGEGGWDQSEGRPSPCRL